MSAWTVLGMIEWSRGYLAGKGFENARLEAELLLSHTLSIPRVGLYTDHDRVLTAEELARYKGLLKRRLAGEPVQYVTGTAGFMFAEFEVNRSVLIPRPETEALTEIALKFLGDLAAGTTAHRAGGLLVADIGTGSGVIATTIALKVPAAAVYATDVSAEAVALAERNAQRAGVADRVRFLVGPLFDPLDAAGLRGRLSAIVSNPPYVRSEDIAGLPSEVRDFEPRVALDGGVDGLDSLRAIAQDGPVFLAPGGALFLEVGEGQARAVEEMLKPALRDVRAYKDYAGRARIVFGRNDG
ncbi:MAG: peptide chain release factor N(5)-glutamine methyltransferase [Candidatus Eisenbacteria bacterium]|nr:peptide chain release factor N(5)-glutamine methyltransferase [Candidatus Eisenbacteria bacterium]